MAKWWASRNQSRAIGLNLETDYCVMRLSNGALLEIAMLAYTDDVLTAALNCHRIILLIRNYELLIRNYGLLIRNYELLIRIYGLLFRNYELVIRNYELVIRNYELVIRNCELRNIYTCQIWSRSDGRVEGGGQTHTCTRIQTDKGTLQLYNSTTNLAACVCPPNLTNFCPYAFISSPNVPKILFA